MIDDTLRHYYGIDPLSLTIHQSLSMMDSMGMIESGKTGETNHRAIVERQARQARLTNG